MAVTITAPQSGYFDRTGAITVSWTNSITAPPQTAYEIMYKLKTASSWSTLGRVTSTATSANLKPIYDAVSQDAVEFYYKVVVYHDLATLSSGNKEGGVEHSAVYSIMFHGSQIATLKVQETASSTQTYPLFNGSTTPTAKLNVRTTSSATGTAPLVASGHPLAGRGKVITASGYTAFIGGSSPTFAASGQVRYGYFYGYRYQYSLTYYNRANYAYDRFTNEYLNSPVLNSNNYGEDFKTIYTIQPHIDVNEYRTTSSYTTLWRYYLEVYIATQGTGYRYDLRYYNAFAYNTANYSYYNRANYTRQYYAYRASGTYTYGVYRVLNTLHPIAYYSNMNGSYRTSYTYYYRVYLYSTYYRYTYYWYTAYYNVPGGGRAGRTFYRYAYGRRDFYGNSSQQTGYTTRYYAYRQPAYTTTYMYTNAYYGYWPNSYSFYNYISSYTRAAYISSYTPHYIRPTYYSLGYYTYPYSYFAYYHIGYFSVPSSSSRSQTITWPGCTNFSQNPTTRVITYSTYTGSQTETTYRSYVSINYAHPLYARVYILAWFDIWYGYGYWKPDWTVAYFYRYNTYYRAYYRNYYQYLRDYTRTYWYTNDNSYNYTYYTR